MNFRILLFCLATISSLSASDKPGATVVSPTKTFKVVQENLPTLDQVPYWTSAVAFLQSPKNKVTLEPDQVATPSNFYVSPDGRWILRIQKSAAGDSMAFLYQVRSGNTVSPTNPGFGDRVWDFFNKNFNSSGRRFYHTQFVFVAWEPKSLVVSLRAMGDDGHPLETRFRFNLADQTLQKD